MAEKATDNAAHTLMARLVREHTGDLIRYARARVKEPEVAEDLVQLTFVSAWDALGRYAEESSHRTWLFAILKHKLADHYRKVYRENAHLSGLALGGDEGLEGICEVQGHWIHGPQLPEDAFLPVEERRNEVLDKALRQCLDALPPQWRSAVEMKFLLGMDGRTICAELGISDTNYWQQLHRAKLKLRACIEGLLNEP